MDKKQKALATAEKRNREHHRAFDPHSFNTEDYKKLKAGVKEFMAPMIKLLSRNQLVEKDHINLTAYVSFLFSFMFDNQLGVSENMMDKEFLNRHFVKEQNMFVIPVEKHKTASKKSAGVALSVREEAIFKNYKSFVRPYEASQARPAKLPIIDVRSEVAQHKHIHADVSRKKLPGRHEAGCSCSHLDNEPQPDRHYKPEGEQCVKGGEEVDLRISVPLG